MKISSLPGVGDVINLLLLFVFIVFGLIYWESLISEIKTWKRKWYYIDWNYQFLSKNTAQHIFWKDFKRNFSDSHTLYIEVLRGVLLWLGIQSWQSKLKYAIKSKSSCKYKCDSPPFVFYSSNFVCQVS